MVRVGRERITHVHVQAYVGVHVAPVQTGKDKKSKTERGCEGNPPQFCAIFGRFRAAESLLVANDRQNHGKLVLKPAFRRM